MIVGLGIDIVEINRIEKIYKKYQITFAQKILHPDELVLLYQKQKTEPIHNVVTYLAARFAAKEAAVKALGTGFSQGITFQDIVIHNDTRGKPILVLYNHAQSRMLTLGAAHGLVSLSHSKETACAVVILESLEAL